MGLFPSHLTNKFNAKITTLSKDLLQNRLFFFRDDENRDNFEKIKTTQFILVENKLQISAKYNILINYEIIMFK